MTDEQRVEILAMNMWLGLYGVTAIRPEWTEWAGANRGKANALRVKAAVMVGVATGQKGRDKKAAPRTAHHHSLGWLYG